MDSQRGDEFALVPRWCRFPAFFKTAIDWQMEHTHWIIRISEKRALK